MTELTCCDLLRKEKSSVRNQLFLVLNCHQENLHFQVFVTLPFFLLILFCVYFDPKLRIYVFQGISRQML